MGCGASKAAQVSEDDINILNHPAKRTSRHEAETGMIERRQQEEREDGEEREEGEGAVEAVYSGQSEIERAVREATAMSPSTATPSVSSGLITSVPASISAPVAFEVCMSPDDRVEPRTLPPPRLKKLDSAPVLTTEMLEMKQHKVAERKKEELEKRLGRSRMSKKDRLRKEIMAAREMSNASESGGITESFGYSRLQGEEEEREEPAARMGRGRGLEGGVVGDSYDINTQMEGDTIYNTGEEEFWENSDGRQRSDDREDTSMDGSSTNNLEQYM